MHLEQCMHAYAHPDLCDGDESVYQAMEVYEYPKYFLIMLKLGKSYQLDFQSIMFDENWKSICLDSKDKLWTDYESSGHVRVLISVLCVRGPLYAIYNTIIH